MAKYVESTSAGKQKSGSYGDKQVGPTKVKTPMVGPAKATGRGKGKGK